jgi:hypothetical protein
VQPGGGWNKFDRVTAVDQCFIQGCFPEQDSSKFGVKFGIVWRMAQQTAHGHGDIL